MRRAWLLAVLAVVAVAPARAQERLSVEGQAEVVEPTRIVLVSGPGLDDLAGRFAAELSSLRFEVIRKDAAAPSNAELEALAVSERARAAVRVAAADSAIDLWLVNPKTHEALYRRIAAERDPAVAVLRSLEILRGSLVDLQALEEAEPAPTPPKPPPPPPVPTPEPPPRLWLGLGAQGLLIGADVPGAGAQVSLRYAMTPHLRLRSEVWLPLGAWRVEGEGGRASAWLAGPTLSLLAGARQDGVVAPAVGLGVAALALHVQGEAASGFRAASSTRLLVVPHARAELSLRLSSRVSASGAIVAGYATPRPVLLFADERQSAINPLLSAGLCFELGLD